MSVFINRAPPVSGDPNGVIYAPKDALFFKSGSFYKINYSGSYGNDWQNLFFKKSVYSKYFYTLLDTALIKKIDTGSYLYVKTTNELSNTGWKLVSNKSPLQPFPTPTPSVTRTITPTPSVTKTATPTVTPTPTATPTVTPTATVTPTITPTKTSTQTPTPTRTPTKTPTLTPTNTPTNTVTPTLTPTLSPTNTVTPTVTSSPPWSV